MRDLCVRESAGNRRYDNRDSITCSFLSSGSQREIDFCDDAGGMISNLLSSANQREIDIMKADILLCATFSFGE